MRWDARADSNQREIVEAARRMGATVMPTFRMGQGYPDYVIGKNGVNLLIEIKGENSKLTPKEREFFDTWKGQRAIVRSVDDLVNLLEDVND